MNCTALSIALVVMVMIVMVMMVMLSGGQVTARGCATKDKVKLSNSKQCNNCKRCPVLLLFVRSTWLFWFEASSSSSYHHHIIVKHCWTLSRFSTLSVRIMWWEETAKNSATAGQKTVSFGPETFYFCQIYIIVLKFLLNYKIFQFWNKVDKKIQCLQKFL